MLIKNNNYQIFYINSYSRINGTNSNFSYKLQIDQTKNYNKVVVLQASIPKTYYMISKNSNTFILQENGQNIIITVPPGNYNTTSFKSAVSQLFTLNSLNGWTYSIISNNSDAVVETNLFTFNVTGNSSQPSIIFSGSNNNCYENLGFNANSVNTFVSNSLISTNVVNFSKESTLFIHSDICQNKLTDNTLQEIYTSGIGYSSFIQYTCFCPEFYAKNYVGKSDVYQFYLTDENGNEIDTNGINMNITLCIFEQENINKTLENYVDIQKLNTMRKLKNE